MAHRPPNTKPPMENSTPFDLNQALGQWRASLQNLGRFHAEELEELEGHLRESISLLHSRGLSIAEAFAIATRRLGSERQLSAEFAKANPQRLWTERAMWMVTGVLMAYAVSVVTSPVTTIVMKCTIWSGLNGHQVGALILLAGWIIWVGAATIAYWAFSRHISRRDRLAKACIQRPVLTGLGLFIGLECLQYGMWYVSRFAEPLFGLSSGHHSTMSQPNLDILDTWSLWGGLLTQSVWLAAGPFLAAYVWRKRGRLASESPTLYELPPGEHEAARALQSQGLSHDEASLVLRWRRCPLEVVAQSPGPASDRSIWLERAVWMVTGVALRQGLAILVATVVWPLVMVSRPAAPLYQHATGLASACLSLMLGGALIGGLWRWVTRHPRQIGLIGDLCRHRPFLSALALILICACIGVSEYGLFIFMVPREVLRGPSSIGPIVTQWITYSVALPHLIIPIALLLWLARRWRSGQTNPAPCR